MKGYTEKIISTLYLAVSDKREAILESIVKNILYSFDEPITIDEIHELIISEFQINTIKEELIESIESISRNGNVIKVLQRYELTADQKALISRGKIALSEIEGQRFERFNQRLVDSKLFSKEQITDLWENLNSYIYQCFLEEGRDAINSF